MIEIVFLATQPTFLFVDCIVKKIPKGFTLILTRATSCGIVIFFSFCDFLLKEKMRFYKVGPFLFFVFFLLLGL